MCHEQQCTRVHTKFSTYRFVHVYCNCATIMIPILNSEFQGPQPDGDEELGLARPELAEGEGQSRAFGPGVV
jgi:hypothetical protein